MSPRREALFLAHRIPFPPDKGDKIRSLRILELMAARFATHVAAFVDDPEDFRHEAELSRRCASVTLISLDKRWATARSARGFFSGDALSVHYYRDQRMVRRVRALRDRPLAVEVAFSSTMAQYLDPPAEGRPRIVDLCDADSEKWSAYAAAQGSLMRAVYEREGRRLAEAETRVVNEASAAFAISPEEAAVLARRDGVRNPVLHFGNGVDAERFDPLAIAPIDDGADVVFVGAMDYAPNADAMRWFIEKIWPNVRAIHPNARFAAIGPRPPADVTAFDGAAGVRVTGRVDDVRAHLCAAKVSVAPMKIARGVQNKILEAMAMGLPVVTTSPGLEGVAASVGREIVVADDEATIADEIARLLSDPARRATIGAAARARIIADYSWDAQLRPLAAAFDRLVDK